MTEDDSSRDRETGDPTLADRIEASEDFRASIEQSVALVRQHRRILLLLVIASLVVAGLVFVYPTLF